MTQDLGLSLGTLNPRLAEFMWSKATLVQHLTWCTVPGTSLLHLILISQPQEVRKQALQKVVFQGHMAGQ